MSSANDGRVVVASDLKFLGAEFSGLSSATAPRLATRADSATPVGRPANAAAPKRPPGAPHAMTPMAPGGTFEPPRIIAAGAARPTYLQRNHRDKVPARPSDSSAPSPAASPCGPSCDASVKYKTVQQDRAATVRKRSSSIEEPGSVTMPDLDFCRFSVSRRPLVCRALPISHEGSENPAESAVLQKSGWPGFTGAPAVSALAPSAKVEVCKDEGV